MEPRNTSGSPIERPKQRLAAEKERKCDKKKLRRRMGTPEKMQANETIRDSASPSPRRDSVSPQADSSANPAGTELKDRNCTPSESVHLESQHLAFARDSEGRTIDDKSSLAQIYPLRPVEGHLYPVDLESAVNRPRSSPPSTPAQPVTSLRLFVTTADINKSQSGSLGRRSPIKGLEPIVLGSGHTLRSQSGNSGRWYPIKVPTPSVLGPGNASRSISSTNGLQPQLPFDLSQQQLEPLKRSYSLPRLQKHRPGFLTDYGILVSDEK